MRLPVIGAVLLAASALAMDQPLGVDRRHLAQARDVHNNSKEARMLPAGHRAAVKRSSKSIKAAAIKAATKNKKKKVDPKALSALSSWSSELNRKSKSLQAKSASLAAKKKSASRRSSASKASAAKQSKSLASLASKASASAKKVAASAKAASSAAKAASSASKSIASARASLSSAEAAFSAGGGAAGAAASASAAKSIASVKSILDAELTSLKSQASKASSAQASLSTISANLASSKASVAQATASLAAQIASVTASFASVGSSLDSVGSQLATSTSLYGVQASSLSVAAASLSSASSAFAADGAAVTALAGQLAGESAALEAASAAVAASAAAAAASAAAPGLSLTCVSGKFLYNGHCLATCPLGTTGELGLSPQDWGYCCTADETLMTANGCIKQCPSGSYMNAAGDCLTSAECVIANGTPDSTSNNCCFDPHAATCAGTDLEQALTCQDGWYFTPSYNHPNVGTCTNCGDMGLAIALDRKSCVATVVPTSGNGPTNCGGDINTRFDFGSGKCECVADKFIVVPVNGEAYCASTCLQTTTVWDVGYSIPTNGWTFPPSSIEKQSAQICRAQCAKGGYAAYAVSPSSYKVGLKYLATDESCICFPHEVGLGAGDGTLATACTAYDAQGAPLGAYDSNALTATYWSVGSTAPFTPRACPSSGALSISGACTATTSSAGSCSNAVTDANTGYIFCCGLDAGSCSDPITPLSCVNTADYTLTTFGPSTACVSKCAIPSIDDDALSPEWTLAPFTFTLTQDCINYCTEQEAYAWASNLNNGHTSCYCFDPTPSASFDISLDVAQFVTPGCCPQQDNALAFDGGNINSVVYWSMNTIAY